MVDRTIIALKVEEHKKTTSTIGAVVERSRYDPLETAGERASVFDQTLYSAAGLRRASASGNGTR